MNKLTKIRTTQPGRRGGIILLAVLLPVIALLWRSGEPTSAATSGNGRVIFASDRTGDWEIFAMNPDGSNQVNLTKSPSKDERPGASPDGSKIAFGRTETSNTDIYVMNADGSGLKRLTTAKELDHAPQWSPDGSKIAFRSDRDGNAEIYVMNADGSNQTRLTNDPAHDHGPDWSPDGTRIVFSSRRDDNDDIFVMNADGSNVKRLTTNPAADFGASWSPDGQRFVFRSDRNGAPEVYIMNVDGSGQTNLTNNAGWDRGPAWSPDGKKVIFYSDRDGDYEIYVMNPDGSNQTRLTNVKGRDFQPDWSSDGMVIEPTCYALTRAHGGQGSDPAASPTKSVGCGAGEYVAGEIITLTAAPAADWRVAGWTGTNNDSSTATTNTVTMPAANHTAGVIYEQIPATCYPLDRSRNPAAGGSIPTASPGSSSGCGSGNYTAGQAITLTAAPAAGWRVAGWTGTNNDSSTATTNTVTMPAANHTAGVIYEQIPANCRTLTLDHTGQGADPIGDPPHSPGCVAGQYVAGESIVLTAAPASGWRVASWNGTNDDGSTAATNTVIMPDIDYAAGVTYIEVVEECPYLLALTHTGQGASPVAKPAHSAGCGEGRYRAEEQITLTAAPATGWHVAGWSGTNDDGSASLTNTIIMPASNHAASVNYAPDSASKYTVNLPIVVLIPNSGDQP